MQIKYTVRLPCMKEAFIVCYVKSEAPQRDMPIEYYDTHKISILLTDGLAAVMNEQVLDIGRYGVLFFNPEEIHFGRFLKQGPYSYLDFYIPRNYFHELFGNDDLLRFLRDTSADRVNYVIPKDADQLMLLHIIEATIKAAMQQHDDRLFLCMLNTVRLCGKLYEEQKKDPVKNSLPPIVSKTLLYISENYERKISLKQLADHANCSVAYLSRIFKAYTGKTVYHHLAGVRIKNAQLFLRKGCSVTETCYLSGFDDCSNFIRTFKNMIGSTPNEWKRRNLNDHFR